MVVTTENIADVTSTNVRLSTADVVEDTATLDVHDLPLDDSDPLTGVEYAQQSPDQNDPPDEDEHSFTEDGLLEPHTNTEVHTTWTEAEQVAKTHSTYNLRDKPRRNWPKILSGKVLTTMSIRRALKENEKESMRAMLAEMKQITEKKAWHAILREHMTEEQRRKVLRTLMFLKRKRDGRLKASTCVDGRKY